MAMHHQLSRRNFLINTCSVAAVYLCLPQSVVGLVSGITATESRYHETSGKQLFCDEVVTTNATPVVMTVTGSKAADELGFTLAHEHVMVDFVGAGAVSPARYNASEVIKKALPYLQEVKKKGCRTMVDCTPAYLGRDVMVLQKLAQATGLNILTNTGYYGAAGEKYIPAHAYTETTEALAKRWVDEWTDGIEGTGIRPGFLKSGVDKFPLSAVQQKLVAAAAQTHVETGLTLAIHTGDGKAALEEMRIIHDQGVHASAWIWVHAQNETNRKIHFEVAAAGGWVSFDGYNKSQEEKYTKFISDMKEAGYLSRILISQDSGWYHVGEADGGKYNDYNAIADSLVPSLRTKGFTSTDIKQIFEINPAKAFTISKRLLKKN